MLIRSQNKLKLVNINNTTINIDECNYKTFNFPIKTVYNIVTIEGVLLGVYSSKKQAVKVLDMIEKLYQEPTYINDQGGGEYAKYEHKVFQMPEDEEVVI